MIIKFKRQIAAKWNSIRQWFKDLAADFKGEKTIRSETTKVFLVIFVILLAFGAFSVISGYSGSVTFDRIQSVYLRQFRSAEVMKQRALEIIGIYYLLASDQDLNIQMGELQRYDGLAANFQDGLKELEELWKNEPQSTAKARVLELAQSLRLLFDQMNENSRQMTFALMGGEREKGKEFFGHVQKDIKEFKAQVDEIETLVSDNLSVESRSAQKLLKGSALAALILTILGVLGTLKLISYLMKFLSVTLLPISNLMHNMRQAVFAIDKNKKVIGPVSRYSSVVFGDDIVSKDVNSFLYRNLDPLGETKATLNTALGAIFGEDDLQWSLMEDHLPGKVLYSDTKSDSELRTLKLTYSPLWDKQQKLQSLMIVAEDISEVERLREESHRKQGEISVIQGLVNMNRADVEPFFNQCLQQIDESFALLQQINASVENQRSLFRILHTIKGNARMFALDPISESVHIAESTVVEINKTLAAGEKVGPEILTRIQMELSAVEEVLGKYFSAAERLFGLNNNFKNAKLELIQSGLIKIEEEFAGGRKFDSNELIDNLKRSAISLGSNDMAECLERLRDAYRDQTGLTPEMIAQLSAGYRQLLLASKRLLALELSHSQWIPVLQHIYNLSSQWGSRPNNGIIDVVAFNEEIRLLIAKAEINRLGYPILWATRLQRSLIDGDKLDDRFNEIWSYVSFVCSLEGKNLDDSEVYAKPWGAKATALRHLFVAFTQSLFRAGVKPEEFEAVVRSNLKNFNDDWRQFFGSAKFTPAINQAFENFSRNSRLATEGNVPEVPGLCVLADVCDHSAILTIELGSLLLPSVTNIDPDAFGLARKSIEIEAGTFGQMLEVSHKFQKMPSLVEPIKSAVDRLHKLLQRSLEVQVRSIFWKLSPMVADLSQRLNKSINFRVSGTDFTVPRSIAFELRDALVHLVRNSLDHGIETPEVRTQSGKSAGGLIEVLCSELVEDHSFQIVITDDGRGIDTDKLIKKAVAAGVITQSIGESLSKDAATELIYAPNLSTKDEVTALSGRGVGMDAVKSVVRRLGGTIKTESTVGKGTRFTITFSRDRFSHDAKFAA